MHVTSPSNEYSELLMSLHIPHPSRPPFLLTYVTYKVLIFSTLMSFLSFHLHISNNKKN